MPVDLAHLNPPQREAVRYLDGPCLVIAGAGSGKTRVIAHKIQYLIDAGVKPGAIGAITFTNKAAGEMAERLTGMLPKLRADDRPLVCTFHSLGVRMLRADGQALGLKRNFSILDSDDALGIITSLLGTTDRKLARAALARISLWKNGLVEPARAAAEAADAAEHAVARAYHGYAETLGAYQAVDFDDLIRLPLQLLASSDDVARRWRERLRYLLVDEYQDTNTCQYELLRLLVGPRAAFTAVGDDDQSIYGWRGATIENLARLGHDFPRLRVIKLEQNYRSSASILRAANQLIANNPKLHQKKLWSEFGPGEPIQVVPCEHDEAEAETVVMRLQAMKFERRASFADFAILYRGNHQARIIEQALRKAQIPYVLSGGQSFFERAEIRDLLAWLRLLANEDDDPAFIRAITTPRRGIGTVTLATLGAYAGERQISMFEALFETGFETRIGARQLGDLREFGHFINRIRERAARDPAPEVLDQLVSAIGYREFLYDNNDEKLAAQRWQNASDFVEWLKKRAENDGGDLIKIAQTVALLSQLDGQRDDGDLVRMSTIHASKGLEFPHVFLVGCEEGILPHHGGLSADEVAAEAEAASGGEAPSDELRARRVEEERRLMYVAVTRARRSLTLSWCRARKRGRDKLLQIPSRFIAEMELDARPASRATVSVETARGRLGALKALLASRS